MANQSLQEIPDFTKEDAEKLTAPASPDLRYFESGEAFRYIGQIKDKFQQAMEERRLGTAAKAVGFTGFYKIVQAYKKANSEQSMKIIDMDNVSAFDVQPFELNTKTWHADETGIWRYGRGEPVYACMGVRAARYQNDLLHEVQVSVDMESARYGLVGGAGEVLLPCGYTAVWWIADDRFLVQDESQWRVVNSWGKVYWRSSYGAGEEEK